MEEAGGGTVLYFTVLSAIKACTVLYGGGGGESPGHQLGPALHDEVDSHVGVAGREVVHLGREPSLPSPQSCWHTFRSFGIGSSFHGPVWRRYHRAGLTVW